MKDIGDAGIKQALTDQVYGRFAKTVNAADGQKQEGPRIFIRIIDFEEEEGLDDDLEL